MAPPIGYLLRDEDIRKIGDYLRTYAHRFINTTGLPGNNDIDNQEMPSTGFYIAKTPTGGIPGLTVFMSTGEGDIPGRADCQVFIMVPNAPNTETQPVANLTVPVHNFSVDPIDENVWIQVGRDQYGKWVALNTPATSERAIGFVAELTSSFDPVRGYDWKRMRLKDGGDYEEYTPTQTGRNAFFPDEDETWGPGTRGWLFVNPDGAYGTSTSTFDDYAYIFIPVYRERVYCVDGGLEQQYSLDGGETWTTDIQLGVTCDGTGTTTTSSDTIGCGWVAGLRPENCISLEVIETSGNCIGIDEEQTLILSSSGGLVWTSGADTPEVTGTADVGTADDNFSYIDGSGPAVFSIINGIPYLTIDGIYLVLDRCGNDGDGNYIEFLGGYDLCNPVGTGDIIACESGTFRIRLRCITCPTLYYCVVTSGDCGADDAVYEVLLLTRLEALELGDLVCSGPYSNSDVANANCVPCCEGASTNLYAHLSASTGGCAVDGTVVTVTYVALSSPRQWLGSATLPGHTQPTEFNFTCNNGVWSMSSYVSKTLCDYTTELIESPCSVDTLASFSISMVDANCCTGSFIVTLTRTP